MGMSRDISPELKAIQAATDNSIGYITAIRDREVKLINEDYKKLDNGLTESAQRCAAWINEAHDLAINHINQALESIYTAQRQAIESIRAAADMEQKTLEGRLAEYLEVMRGTV